METPSAPHPPMLATTGTPGVTVPKLAHLHRAHTTVGARNVLVPPQLNSDNVRPFFHLAKVLSHPPARVARGSLDPATGTQIVVSVCGGGGGGAFTVGLVSCAVYYVLFGRCLLLIFVMICRPWRVCRAHPSVSLACLICRCAHLFRCTQHNHHATWRQHTVAVVHSTSPAPPAAEHSSG